MNREPGIRPWSAAAMSEDDLRRLAEGLAPPDCSQPFGVYVFRPDQREAALPLHIEEVVFEEAFGNSPELLAAEYGSTTSPRAALRHRPPSPRAAGMMRIIVPSNNALKSLHDITAVGGFPSPSCTDGRQSSTCPRAPGTWRPWRSLRLPGRCGPWPREHGPHQGLSIVSERCGVEHLVAILHLPVLRMIQWKFHKPFTLFKGMAQALPRFTGQPPGPLAAQGLVQPLGDDGRRAR